MFFPFSAVQHTSSRERKRKMGCNQVHIMHRVVRLVEDKILLSFK